MIERTGQINVSWMRLWGRLIANTQKIHELTYFAIIRLYKDGFKKKYPLQMITDEVGTKFSTYICHCFLMHNKSNHTLYHFQFTFVVFSVFDSLWCISKVIFVFCAISGVNVWRTYGFEIIIIWNDRSKDICLIKLKSIEMSFSYVQLQNANIVSMI